jgi:hypothetical protein
LLIKTISTRLKRPKIFNLKNLLIIISASIVFGITKVINQLPEYATILFLIIVLFYHFKTKSPMEILIEE